MAAITSYDMDTLPPLVSITAVVPVPVIASTAVGVPLIPMAAATAAAAAALAAAVAAAAVVVVAVVAVGAAATTTIESVVDTVFDSDSSCSRDLFGTLPYRTAGKRGKEEKKKKTISVTDRKK